MEQYKKLILPGKDVSIHMDKPVFTEKTLESTPIWTGKVVKLRRDTVELVNGGTSFREVVAHAGGVVILPVDGEGRAWLVRQYRYPVERELLEIPAGKLEPGEEPEAGARRELKEETGLTAGRLISFGYEYPSPGFCDEKLWLYLALDLQQGEACPDEDEFLAVERLPLEELAERALRGELPDGKSLALLFLAREYLKREKK